MNTRGLSTVIFWGLIAVVVLSPLPLASNRPLPASLLALTIGALLLMWGVQHVLPRARGQTAASRSEAELLAKSQEEEAQARTDRLERDGVLQRYAAALAVGFIVLLGWYALQTAGAVPAGWRHPAWTEASTALGVALPGTIAIDPAAARTLTMRIATYGGVFFLAYQYARDRRRARLLFWSVTWAGLAYAAYGLVAYLAKIQTVAGLEPTAYPGSLTSTFANRNAYATYASLAVMAALAPLLFTVRQAVRDNTTPRTFFRHVSEEAPASTYLALLAILLGSLGVALTGSRAGVAALMLGFGCFGLMLAAIGEIRWRTFFVFALLGFGVLYFFAAIGGGAIMQRLASAPDFSRPEIFGVGLLAWEERPWIGHGLGGFGAAFNRANDGSAALAVYVDLAHNTYLELAIEGGLIGLLLSLALLGAVLGVLMQGLFSRARGTSFAVSGLCAAVVVGSHAVVDFGVQMPAVAITLLALLGAAAGQSLAGEPRTARRGEAVVGAAGEPAEPERKQRRRRRSSGGRPLDADESVTPTPELPFANVHQRATNIDWGRVAAHVGPPAGGLVEDGRIMRREREGFDPLSAAYAAQDRAASPTPPAGVDPGDYQSALARWRALMDRERGAAQVDPPPAEPPPPMPSPEDMYAALQPAPAPPAAPPYPTSAPQPPAFPPGAPGPVAEDGDSQQPPTPETWPGATPTPAPAIDAFALPPELDAQTGDGEPRKSAVIYELPRRTRDPRGS